MKAWMLIIVLSTGAFAQIPNVKIENFKADYTSPSGQGSADTFLYDNEDYGKNFSVELQSGSLILNTENGDFSLDSLPAQVSEWKNLKVEKVDLNASDKSISLRSERIEYTNGEDKDGYISGISLDCELNQKTMLDSALDMCLNKKMTFYLPFVGGMSINNINIWTDNNKLNFSLKNGVWIKGYGGIFYDEDQRKIRIRIDKAKTGFINVTGKVFSELKAMENEFVSVNRPWVEISLP
tara:strand:- start:33062 stop:33775 length:714 start_codon:yes stop_codon:yes gene_type:complete